jgi:hypothetical protein
MLTIKKTYSGPRINWQELCDLCGAPWHASKLTCREDNLLVCPMCKSETCALTLAKLEAASSIKPDTITPRTRRRI